MPTPATVPSRAARRALTVMLLPAVVVLAGCGTPRAASPSGSASPGASAVSQIPELPRASDFLSAVVATRSSGAARVDIEVLTTIDDPDPSLAVDRALTGSGAVFLEPGFGDIAWSSDLGPTREIVNDLGTYVQAEPPDGRWYLVDGGATTPTTAFADPLRDLGLLAGVESEGPEQIQGVAATRFAGTLELDPRELAALGLSDEEVSAIGDAWQGASEEVTVWVGPDGRIIRIDRQATFGDEVAAPVSVFASTELSDFGTFLDVAPPPSGSVDSTPDAQ